MTGERGVDLGREDARHADAVLVLREALVLVGLGERPVGHEVVLVGREDQPATERVEVPLLPRVDRVEHRLRLGARVRTHVGLVEWSDTPSGTTPTVASSGKRSRMPSSVSSSTAPSFTPGHTTIWPCTSTPASSSAPSQRRLVAPRRLRSSRGADLGVGRVDRHVERAEPLGDARARGRPR